MPLSFESQIIDKVAVIRCKGRITLGPEIEALEAEVDRQTRVDGTSTFRAKRVILELAETDFIDSSGLGSLVRILGILRAAGGGLKLCRMSARVRKVFDVTNLGSVFPDHASEALALEAFLTGARTSGERLDSSKTKIVCVDTSKDLLAGLSALLTGAGYEVLTTRYIGEAVTLVKVTRPRVVICGPGAMAVPAAPAIIEDLRKTGGDLKVLNLPSEFYTAEAGEAGQDLLTKVQSLIGA